MIQVNEIVKDNILHLQFNDMIGIEKTFENFEDIDDELTSIGNTVGKNTVLYKQQFERIDKGKAQLESISAIIKNNAKKSPAASANSKSDGRNADA